LLATALWHCRQAIVDDRADETVVGRVAGRRKHGNEAGVEGHEGRHEQGERHHAIWDYWPNERKGRRVTIKGDRPR